MRVVDFLLCLGLAVLPASARAQTSVPFFDEELPVEEAPVVYVVEVSGSMGWDFPSYPPKAQARRPESSFERAATAVMESLEALPDGFRFNLIAFNCDIHQWMPEPVPATPESREAAVDWFVAIEPRGASATGPAVARALEDDTVGNVILLSDGAPSCGASGFNGHTEMMLGANTQGAKIHTFGIGAHGRFAQFLQDIANHTDGIYVSVD